MTAVVQPRYPPKTRDELDGEQREIHDWLSVEIPKYFGDKFTWRREDGALLGLFPVLLDLPKPVCIHMMELLKLLGTEKSLPPSVREVTILVAGVHFGSELEMYSHKRIAEKTGRLTDVQVEDILAGRRPSSEKGDIEVGYDLTKALLAKQGPLEDAMWAKGVETFGKRGTTVLAQYAGFYSYVALLLNATGMGAPEGESI